MNKVSPTDLAWLPTQGEPVSVVQLYNIDYHHLVEFLSSSSVKLYLTSPRLYKRFIDGLHVMTPTKSMRIGSALDGLLTNTFSDEMAVKPDVDRRTKSGKAKYAAWREALGDREEISREEYDTAREMAQRCLDHPGASKLLSSITSTQNSYFTNRAKNEKLNWRVRPDAMLGPRHILEIKTHESFSRSDEVPDEFARMVYKWGWYRQAALYRRMIAVEQGVPDHEISFTYLTVGNTAPWDVHCFKLRERWFDLGLRELQLAAISIANHLDMDYWDDPQEVIDLEIPTWIKAKLNK
jgi:exodeoxyribonuclease VIII